MLSTTNTSNTATGINSSINKLFSFRYYVFVLFISLVIFRIIEAAIPFGVFGYIDELLIVAFFLYASFLSLYTLKLKKTFLSIGLLILSIFVLSYFSSYYAGMTKTIIQSVTYTKFIIFFMLLYYGLDDKLFHKFIKFLFYFTIVGFLLNLFLGSVFFDLINARTLERNGIYRYFGFQNSPNILALASSILIFYSLYNNKKFKNIKWNIIFIFITLLTGSHTGLLFLFILYFIYFVDKISISPSTKLVFTVFSLFIFFAIIFLSGIDEKITHTSERFEAGNDSGYARTVVVYNAIHIAVDNFPFGAGAASYATPLSRESEIYYDYGMEQIYIVRLFLARDERNTGMYDSSFGMLLGELGFLGTILFLLLHFIIFYKIFRSNNKNTIVLGALFSALIFVASTTPVFVQWDIGLYLALMFLIPLKKEIKEPFVNSITKSS